MWPRRRSTDASESDDLRRARKDAERAEAERLRVESGMPEARAIGDTIRNALDRNHFGESIERALARRGRPL